MTTLLPSLRDVYDLDEPPAMEPVTTEGDVCCSICPSQHVSSYHTGKEVDKSIKHRIFHEACHQCDNAEVRSSARLCDLCRHLRLRHHLTCYPRIFSKHEKLAVRLRHYSENSAYCDFCRFVGSFVKERPNYDPDSWTKSGVELAFGANGLHCLDAYGSLKVYGSKKASSSFAFSAELHGQSPLRLREYVDWHWLRQWVDDTQDKSKAMNEPSSIFSLRQELQDVRVIDVSQACVVPLPCNSEYIALSYVWGTAVVGPFQALVSNIHLLEIPGSLESIDLPLTITDAIEVCKQLHQRYLWVDRLCIIQDEPWIRKSIQLNQMGSIYHRATMTLVAAEGDCATYGLAGVSPPRKVTQQTYRVDESLELVENSPSLRQCMFTSKWNQRGWTYQEFMASSMMLFFTNGGVFLQRGTGYSGRKKALAERPAYNSPYWSERNGLALIETYSSKKLTYSGDILRAFSGILFALYGGRTSFGMTWDDFDHAILWKPQEYDRKPLEPTKTDVFPRWSWISANGPVKYDGATEDVFGIAYWGRAATGGQSMIGPLRWQPIEPPKDDDDDCNLLPSGHLMAALAWLNGCIRSEVPDLLLVDCSSEDYNKRMHIWPRISCYWHDAFRGYKEQKVFDDIDTGLLNYDECLIVHTQKASFTLYWESQIPWEYRGYNSIPIRTNDGKIAGEITLDKYSAQRLETCGQTKVQFIALSVSERYHARGDIMARLANHCENLTLSEFYGCPCSSQNGEAGETAHIVACPKHADFFASISFHPNPLHFDYRHDKYKGGEQKLAFIKHIAELSYLDIHGRLLHGWNIVPELNVMLIAPSMNLGEERKVYERLGIGKIYLKRWVEASPTFKTIVLE